MQENRVIIRTASAEDAVAICHLRKKLWLETYQQPAYKQAVLNQDFTSDTQIINFANSIVGGKHYHLVAEYKNKVIGWAAAELEKNEIIALYVDADYQGKGLGKSFYNVLMKQLNKQQAIIIYAVLGNEKAIGFYRNRGFEPLEQPSEQQIIEGLKNHKLPLLKMQLPPQSD